MVKRLSIEQAFSRIRQYCAYQERCHREVKEKLYTFGMYKKEVEELTARLIEENYLNEERFAIQYAGGKFRMNKWGRIKIKQALRMKQVSDYSINKAMKEITDNEYLKTLQKLANQKQKTLTREKNSLVKRKKLHDYLLQKGFETEWINRIEIL